MNDSSTPPVRVLVVEDNDDHYDLLRLNLRSVDESDRVTFEPHRVCSLESAEAALADHRFDVILLDLGLPDSTIGSTLDSVMPLANETAIVVLTSLDDERFGMSAIKQGAQDYLVKSRLDRTLLQRSILHAIERKSKETALARANAELKRFAHTVAHEIRSPAATAQMAVAAVREMLGHVPKDAERMMDITTSSLKTLLQLVNDLLEFAKNEEVAVADEVVDLNQICDDVTAGVSMELDELGGVVRRMSLPQVRGSRTQMSVLFQNLISNAIKYRGTEPPIITIESDGPSVVVRDNGRGIDPVHHEKLFQMFYRADPSCGVLGTGVGLALCKNIMSRMNGTIGVESTVGVGTTFTLNFAPEPSTKSNSEVGDESRTASV